MGARNLLEGAGGLSLLFAKIFLCLILAAGDRLAERIGTAADRARRPALGRP